MGNEQSGASAPSPPPRTAGSDRTSTRTTVQRPATRDLTAAFSHLRATHHSTKAFLSHPHVDFCRSFFGWSARLQARALGNLLESVAQFQAGALADPRHLQTPNCPRCKVPYASRQSRSTSLMMRLGGASKASSMARRCCAVCLQVACVECVRHRLPVLRELPQGEELVHKKPDVELCCRRCAAYVQRWVQWVPPSAAERLHATLSLLRKEVVADLSQVEGLVRTLEEMNEVLRERLLEKAVGGQDGEEDLTRKPHMHRDVVQVMVEATRKLGGKLAEMLRLVKALKEESARAKPFSMEYHMANWAAAVYADLYPAFNMLRRRSRDAKEDASQMEGMLRKEEVRVRRSQRQRDAGGD